MVASVVCVVLKLNLCRAYIVLSALKRSWTANRESFSRKLHVNMNDDDTVCMCHPMNRSTVSVRSHH